MPPKDWSSLAPDLVSCVGDVFLDSGDIDYYVNLRACSMVGFPSSLASHRFRCHVAMGAGMTAPLLFLFSSDSRRWCDPSHPSPRWFRMEHISSTPICTVVSLESPVYITDMGGSVMVVDCLEGHKKPEITTIIRRSNALGQNFLVDNAGELLLVCVPWWQWHSIYAKRTHVFKVDLEGKVLEPVRSIENRAIFLGRRCCLSVNVDHLPAIQGNCIYHYGDASIRLHMYHDHLEDGSREVVTLPALHCWSSPGNKKKTRTQELKVEEEHRWNFVAHTLAFSPWSLLNTNETDTCV
uniref:KIB1-4 beta-propeller domain-containing protein n=1 Tax=Aegilops tauschii TaxID=37682 RepID=M8CKD9_AEGTA